MLIPLLEVCICDDQVMTLCHLKQADALFISATIPIPSVHTFIACSVYSYMAIHVGPNDHLFIGWDPSNQSVC